jgi:hypothetical protein
MTDHPYPRERTWPDAEAEFASVTMTKDETIRLQAAEIERLRVSRDNMADNLTAALAIVKEHADEIERLRELLLEGITVPVQLNANTISPVAWRKDYERRVKEALGDE